MWISQTAISLLGVGFFLLLPVSCLSFHLFFVLFFLTMALEDTQTHARALSHAQTQTFLLCVCLGNMLLLRREGDREGDSHKDPDSAGAAEEAVCVGLRVLADCCNDCWEAGGGDSNDADRYNEIRAGVKNPEISAVLYLSPLL